MISQIPFWKAMYEHMAAHIDQLHAAFERLVTGDENALEEQNPTPFLDQFLLGPPADRIGHRRASESPA